MSVESLENCSFESSGRRGGLTDSCAGAVGGVWTAASLLGDCAEDDMVVESVQQGELNQMQPS